jgi:hypothetical protein
LLSSLRFLNGGLDGSLLVVFGIIPSFPGDGNGFSHFGMHEVSMISFASTIHEARGLKVSDEFSNFSWHPSRIVAEVPLEVA